MPNSPRAVARALLSTAALLAIPIAHATPITDLTSWALLQDPPHPLMSGSATSAGATLLAGSGTISAGTDVGFASINGNTPATSTSGHYFSASGSFSLAIDYNLSFVNPAGLIAVGFGIGEDVTGTNSAGAVLSALNGAASFVTANARSNDVNISGGILSVTAALQGTLFASYDPLTGDVTVGAADTTNASAPVASHTFTGISLNWGSGDLLASFFLRSDELPPFAQAWSGENATAIFSNFRLLDGAPLPIPEPGSLALSAFALAGFLASRRRRMD